MFHPHDHKTRGRNTRRPKQKRQNSTQQRNNKRTFRFAEGLHGRPVVQLPDRQLLVRPKRPKHPHALLRPHHQHLRRTKRTRTPAAHTATHRQSVHLQKISHVLQQPHLFKDPMFMRFDRPLATTYRRGFVGGSDMVSIPGFWLNNGSIWIVNIPNVISKIHWVPIHP